MASADHNQPAVPFNRDRGGGSPCSWPFLLLAFLIFAWGTSYKLSLYKKNPPGSVTPAKLCESTSDNAKSQIDRAIEGHKVVSSGPSINAVSTYRDFVLLLQRQNVPHSETASLAPLQTAPILHLRPPPAPDQRIFL